MTEMDCLVVMTEAQFTMTIHAVESSSLGRCDQWRQSLPPAQIDKSDQTQEMDITRDRGAAGNQWCRHFSASHITVDRLIQAIAPRQQLTPKRHLFNAGYDDNNVM